MTSGMTTSLAPVVLKIGGALAADAGAMADVWDGVAAVAAGGAPVVVVHGGGPQLTEIATALGHAPRLVAGRRVTTDLDLRVALWALRGEINAALVAGATAHGLAAVGVAGLDGPTVVVRRRPPVTVDGATVDFGHVGDVVRVDPRLLRALLAAGFVPVVAPVCADAAGARYNVNADTVAMELAVALGAARLDLVTEAAAVRDAGGAPLAALSAGDADAGVAAGWIAGGMRPKLSTGFGALARGVASVRVVGPAGLADAASGTRLLA